MPPAGEIPAPERSNSHSTGNRVLGPCLATARAKRRQSDIQAVTQVKLLSLVRNPGADMVENMEGNSR